MFEADGMLESDNEPRRPAIKVGIAGLGRAAIKCHVPELKRLPELFKVVAVCDLMKERRDIVEKEFPNVRTYRRTEDMFDDPEIDLIDIALPSTDHAQCALAALKREKWTVVESPLALSHEDANIVKAASIKAKGKLFAYTPELFAPDFRLAQSMLDDARLGDLFEIRLRRQDYIRRDDWQSVKRCGGGAAWYEGQDAVLQAVALLRQPPAQLWSELKRIASLGDAEDFAHIVLKPRGDVTADIEICGGQLPPTEPAFTIRGSRGSFSVMAGANEGMLRVIDPGFKFPRRRSSVRTPPLDDMHEDIPIIEQKIEGPKDVESGAAAFWKALYATIRVAAPFPLSIDEVLEAIRYLQIVKRSSPFAK